VFDLPRSARLVSWFNAWLAGTTTPDDLSELVLGTDTAATVHGLEDEPATLMAAAGRLRRLGASTATLALPVPGDLVGLTGPPALNLAAVDAGEAAVFPGAGIALVPQVVGAGVFWRAHDSNRVAYVPDVRDAERTLRETLIAAAEQLTALDVATWRPEIASALSVLRDEDDAPLPAGYPVRSVRLAGLALRCQGIVELAHEVGSAAVSASQLARRDTTLDELARASRHALVAACSEPPRLADVRAR
jgi:hypothetical protein